MRAIAMKPLKDPTQIELRSLQEHPRYLTAFVELQSLETRLKQAERRESIGQARARGQRATVSIVERAKALVAGGYVSAATPVAEIGAAIEERDILQRAIVAKRADLEAIAAELSYETCKQFAPLAEDALRSALDAVDALFTALETGRIIRAKIVGAGFSLNEHALPIHHFQDAAVLGDSRKMGVDGQKIAADFSSPGVDLSSSPAARFRSWLRSREIINA